MALVLLFLYIPIFVLIVFSFNVTKSRSVFSGFTFDWYIKLFHNGLIMKSLLNTVIVATVASIAATLQFYLHSSFFEVIKMNYQCYYFNDG